MRIAIPTLLAPVLLVGVAHALTVDVSSKDSVCEAASTVAKGLLDYYEGTKYGGTVGMFVQPYYWWAAGHAFGGLIDHWSYCNDDTYEQLIYDAMIHQTGDNYDYIPSNQSTTEGNDDQGFWGFAVLEAAERNFTAPKDPVPDWLALSQAVYNTMWKRWEHTTCSGGLRWQIFTWNSGYDYKNTISQACLFQISARLARFTKNETYVETCETVFTWLMDVGFITITDFGATVYDGANIDNDCADIVHLEWSYNFGVLIGGCAYLYDFTKDDLWQSRTESLTIGAFNAFFRNDTMYERACQDVGTCNNDQRSFKAIFSRCLGMTSVLVPSLRDMIQEKLKFNVQRAAQSCSGGSDGVTCGLNWETDGWDGKWGMGEQMSALEVMMSVLAADYEPPYSANDTGVAVGNAEAGLQTDYTTIDRHPLTITTKDKIASAAATAVVLLVMLIGTIWMCL